MVWENYKVSQTQILLDEFDERQCIVCLLYAQKTLIDLAVGSSNASSKIFVRVTYLNQMICTNLSHASRRASLCHMKSKTLYSCYVLYVLNV